MGCYSNAFVLYFLLSREKFLPFHAQVFTSQRSDTETFGIANLEAMAMELPVVSFGVSGTADYLINNTNTLISPDSRPESLAALVCSASYRLFC